ncbi:TIGR00730 family Rossman fold protein [Parahaliea maris]|uniref:AMP nucleosidase n=1 Tax=Parahaliea maris TaxID=2716870 RepID=A0A5C9A4R5_9GAMM|nr:TIGR00730 family Rossman fold protein [Parahaliea maris]TXS94201.1 TIGR00730 family Rossman fold protein [Parahaliea maris]
MDDDNKNRSVPPPAPPLQRKQRLPWETPKPAQQDPTCSEQLQAILESPSYQPSVEDTHFLESDDARGVRLQLDYLKPERLMRKHGIRHTIVVFGSTRIVEPLAARQRVVELEHALQHSPQDPEFHRQLKIAQRIEENSRYYEVARAFSRLVAESGEGCSDSRLVVMTGGGPGIMEAANRGACNAGGETVGLNITLPHEQFPNPYVTPELCFQFHYFALRKMHFMLRARALVAFPGGFGTLDELFETLTLIQTRKIKPLPVILVGESFWRRAFDVDFLVEEGVIDSEDRDLFWFAESAEDIWESLQLWYERAGEPLIQPNDPANSC